MANKVKITGSGKVLCGGYPGEGVYAEPANINTETTNTSGSQAFTFVFHNVCSASGSDNNSQKVRVNAHYDWSVSFDEFANMSVTLHGYIDSVTATKRGSGPGSCNPLFFLKAGFDANNLPYSITYQVKTYATLGGAGDLGEKKFTIPSGSSQAVPTMYIFNGLNGHQNAWCDGYVDRMEGGLTFSNHNAIIRVAPIISPDCTSDSPVRAILKATIDYKNGDGSNKYTYCVSRDTNFTSCVKSGEGVGTPSVSVTGLQPNTKYYVKWAANNGYKSSEATCSFVTYASNSITSIVTPDYKTANINLAVQNGGQEYAPSTQLQYKKCDATNWTNGGTTDAIAYATFGLTTLDAETCYQARALTTTTAGTYTGTPVEFQTPAKNLAVANYTKIETSVDDTSYDVCANLCYKWETGSVPAKITLYYRVKDGYDTRWYKIDAPDATTATGTNCVQVCGLYPNQTVYETYIHTETVDGEYDSDLSEFTTPVLPEPDIHNCETFGYLTELLCQSVVKLYNGIKTIYANDCTKEACDPNSLNPTQAALWSRALRYLHALSCLLCDMAGVSFTASKEGQYLVGEAGWQDILKTIDESDTENGWKLVTSDAVKRYILDKLHNVWHFHGTVDYLVATKADLSNLPGNASSAIVAGENKVYRKQGSSWVVSTALDDKVDPMGVWHINQASTTTGGGVTYKVQAGSAWYFWNGKWQPMDASIDDLDKIVDELWDKRNLVVINENGQPRIHINTVDRLQYSCSNQPAGERWVTFITEPMDLPAPTYYTVTFDMGEGGGALQPQQVVGGGTAQKPTGPYSDDCTFVQWEDSAVKDVVFDWDTKITKNYTIKAIWDCGTYIATEGNDPITAENGNKLITET